MAVSHEETRKIAKLAHLSFSEEELLNITRDLNEILEYISRLNEVDTTTVEPLSHPVANAPWMREDILKTSIEKTKALKNAPHANEDYFLVPKVIK